ncbi:hypothetical protein GCM10010967_30600 [Dyadobacter beijingensis]|uniref:Repeat domain-containing protein n=1 Tax=Dyadobacter beijingensis TaxID=365489 RepID=A0ABQ2I0H6_9BACT|nr:VCBS repeat-containing protein [Dyadobacter beijingensis]GGM95100.1 hypothetical protein GCM10010967_30600 [Dyadobacter beijingensis]
MKLAKQFWHLVVTAIFITITGQSCGRSGQSADDSLSGELAAGRDAARKRCSTCHLPPDPALLDKETWKKQVLPAMAPYFGIEVWQKSQYFAGERAAMPIAEWTQIVAYYDSLAPAQLPAAHATVPVRGEWAGFTLKKPAADTTHLATTTMVAFDPGAKGIFTSSSEMPALMRWDEHFGKQMRAPLASPATYMLFGEMPVVTAVGEMRAYDVASGEMYRRGANGQFEPKPFITGLRRPLHTAVGDFNRDGRMDYAVSAFGHNQGGLYVFRQKEDGGFDKVPVREIAGATQSFTGDFNGDGWTDLIALFAHADEGIWLFTNDQKGGFTEKNLLRFPPVYGSSSFQVADFNHDGRPDVLYTAGDNSDYSRILKPYHGVYLFLNKGDFQLEQSWFYPVNGATRAVASDFDGDGDLDIASLAFFADLKHNPAEKFLYFRNDTPQGNAKPQFQPFSPPVASSGRWICMDAGDWDNDGDPDIVLGNYSKGFLNQDAVQPDWNVYLPFVVLQNDMKRH